MRSTCGTVTERNYHEAQTNRRYVEPAHCGGEEKTTHNVCSTTFATKDGSVDALWGVGKNDTVIDAALSLDVDTNVYNSLSAPRRS
jgi:hypothetical protein